MIFMKKVMFLVIAVFFSIISYSQTINEYKASNNVTYHLGDTITLGRGSGINGNFIYCQMGDTYSTLSLLGGNGQINEGLPKNQSGVNMVIKKIKEVKYKGAKVISFSVSGGNIVKYKILVEDALATGELKSSGYTSDEALSELKKAKDKLDLGLIKPEKYDSIKFVLTKFIK